MLCVCKIIKVLVMFVFCLTSSMVGCDPTMCGAAESHWSGPPPALNTKTGPRPGLWCLSTQKFQCRGW